MNTHHRNGMTGSALLLALLFSTAPVRADQGTVVKWSQPPVSMQDGTNMLNGEDYPSDVDWRVVPQVPPTGSPFPEPNWNVADDFQSNGLPILTVRWWGSYFDPIYEPRPTPDGNQFDPAIEEGYIISFFSDVPANPDLGNPFSHPGELLGTYVAPKEKVKIEPIPFQDWGQHNVWQYEVNLQDTHLFHPSPLATPISFDEVKDEIYWISIVAENGAAIDPDTWEIRHLDPAIDPLMLEHFWGWLTRPHFFNDVPTETKLLMPVDPTTDEMLWQYGPWRPIQPKHQTFPDMTFELLTIPEPATLALVGLGALVLIRRRRN